jgi:HAD superfamily hydrolase (TIGR01459 family)
MNRLHRINKPTESTPRTLAHPAPWEKSEFAEGLSQFVGRYDLFLIDQWGVLHDGQTVFPTAKACLRKLVDEGKRVVILSNSGKPAAANVRRLAAMGLERNHYTDLVTSGEVLRAAYSKGLPPFSPHWGKRCLFWSSDGDSSLLEGLDLEPVRDLDRAGFILLAGVSDHQPMDAYLDVLLPARDRGLSLICANPDNVRFSSSGMTFSAGAVAQHYQDLGGEVHYVGKPYRAMYDFCFELMPGVDRSRIIAIGDSLSHDVQGGMRAGIDTAFVTDGIHRADFAGATASVERLGVVAKVAQDVGVMPRWVISRLQW